MFRFRDPIATQKKAKPRGDCFDPLLEVEDALLEPRPLIEGLRVWAFKVTREKKV